MNSALELDATQRSAALADGELPGLRAALARGAQLIRWRPGKRAVVREAPTDGVQFRKFLAAKRYARQSELLRAPELAPLFDAGLLAPLEWDDATCSIAFREARGESLHEQLACGGVPDVAALSRRLDALTAAGEVAALGGVLPPFRVDDEFAALDRALALAAAAESVPAPSLVSGMAQVRARVAAPATLGSSGFLHRDLHDKQLFVDAARGGALELIDPDTLACGPLALDRANLAAHLLLRQRQGLAARGGALAAELLERSRSGAVPAAALRFFLVTSLLRLAAVYAIRPTGGAVAESLLADAEAVVTNGSWQ